MRFSALLLLLLSLPSAAFAADVTGVRFGTHPDKQRIVIELSAPSKFNAYALQNPDRIIVDMPDFKWKVGAVEKPGSSLVSDIRHGSIGSNKGRIVLETSRSANVTSSFALPADNSSPNRIVIDFTAATASVTGSDSTPIADKNSRPYSASTTQNLAAQLPLPAHKAVPKQPLAQKIMDVSQYKKQIPLDTPAVQIPDDMASAEPIVSKRSDADTKSGSKQKPLIIIDPGHGGQDPGAHAANGNYEKSIVLAVGLELKKTLEESGQYRVQMTRDHDIFIPLKDRVKFARRNGGDLFVSLHADSMPDSTVTGASVYTLSDTASDKEAEKLAERENKSDAIAGVNLSNQDSDVANILIDLASRDTMNQSRYLANTVVSTMPATGVNMLSRQPHRSAGFAVLKAMDIPSILVEMGYLTNLEESNRLSSREYRQKIAEGLKMSIDAYFIKVAKLTP